LFATHVYVLPLHCILFLIAFLVVFAFAFVVFVFVAFVPDSRVSSFPVWLHSTKQNCEYDGKCTRHNKYFSDWHIVPGFWVLINTTSFVKWLSIFFQLRAAS
jgi:hypothetical protein